MIPKKRIQNQGFSFANQLLFFG